MLVLFRKPGQAIRIGDHIIVTVCKIRPGHVYLGIEAKERYVLALKLDQQIRIDDHVTITVVEIRQGNVRLGIEAGEQTRIDRAEAWESRHRQWQLRRRRHGQPVHGNHPLCLRLRRLVSVFTGADRAP